MNLQIGITLASGGFFLLIDRVLSKNPNDEVLEVIRELRDEIEALRSDLEN